MCLRLCVSASMRRSGGSTFVGTTELSVRVTPSTSGKREIGRGVNEGSNPPQTASLKPEKSVRRPDQCICLVKVQLILWINHSQRDRLRWSEHHWFRLYQLDCNVKGSESREVEVVGETEVWWMSEDLFRHLFCFYILDRWGFPNRYFEI